MLNFYSSKGFCNLHMEAKSVNLVLFCFVLFLLPMDILLDQIEKVT